jgi:hypothetical protein
MMIGHLTRIENDARDEHKDYLQQKNKKFNQGHVLTS